MTEPRPCDEEAPAGSALESAGCCTLLLAIGLGGWAFLAWHLVRMLGMPLHP